MMVVDRYFFHDYGNYKSDAEEWDRRWKRRSARISRKANKKRVKKEYALKLKAMMRYCFGKFLLSISRFNLEMYQDRPLPESSAEPYNKESAEPVVISEKKYGQRLTGDMVMKREIQVSVEETESEAKPAKKRRKWKSSRSRSGSVSGEEYSDGESMGDSTISDPDMGPRRAKSLDLGGVEASPPPLQRSQSDDGNVLRRGRRRGRKRSQSADLQLEDHPVKQVMFASEAADIM